MERGAASIAIFRVNALGGGDAHDVQTKSGTILNSHLSRSASFHQFLPAWVPLHICRS
jgi:hypothetical protein